MPISCECDYIGIFTVGDPKEVTCRTSRECGSCGVTINVLDRMYRWSMYDFEECQTVAPRWMCEECGDMAENLMELGFCFNLSEGIRQQWLDYLCDVEPDNPAVRKVA